MQFFNHSSQNFQSEIFYLIQSWKGGRLHAAPLLDWLTHKISFFKIESLLSKPAISYSISQEMGSEPLPYYQRPEFPTLRSPALSSS